jgi:hypothetical protein
MPIKIISKMLLWRGSLLPLGYTRRSCVGAAECNEAAIFSQAIESRAKDQDQQIAGFASSYRAQRERAATQGQGRKNKSLNN